MFCPICGAKIEETDRECSICGYVIETVQDGLHDPMLAGENTEITEETNGTKSTQKPIIIFVVVFFVLLMGVLAFWFFKGDESDKKTSEKATSETTESNEEKTESSEAGADETSAEQVESISVNDYVGYWNIQNNSDKELTIHNGDDDTVYFSLWYYRKDEISNVSAKFEDNVATFSTAIDGAAIKGFLTFHKDAITVQITHSGRVDMPVEIMEFTERHMTSWVYSKNASTETTDTYTPSDNPQQNTTEAYEYILPFSSERLLTYEDIYFLTPEQLKLARNEIYARHGRMFKDRAIQDYFASQSWYHGSIEPDAFTEDMLSPIERQNVQFIMSYEP